MSIERLAIYEITPTNLLHTICGGRSAALVPWCNHYSQDISHALDVLEGRTTPSEDLKSALIAYCWLDPAEPEVGSGAEPETPAADNVVFISDLLNELVEDAA